MILSFVGPLAGVSLRLSLFHILEPAVLEIVPEDLRLKDLEMLSMVVDQEQLYGLWLNIVNCNGREEAAQSSLDRGKAKLEACLNKQG